MAPLTNQQLFDLAQQHHSAGHLHEAGELYRQILPQQPAHVGALHYLGVLAHQQGRNDVAVELIRKAIALSPNLPEPYNNLGLALKEVGRLDEAITAYQRAIALRPNYASAYHNLGVARQANGQLDQAIDAYRKAVTINPKLPAAYNNLGYALNQRGSFDESVAAFRKVTALNSNSPESHNNLGNALCDSGCLDEAIAAYRKAIALRPHYVDAYANLGNVLVSNHHLDEAVAAFRQVIALRPNYAPGHSNLGNALKDKGKLDEAIAAYRQAIAIDPNFEDALNNLGSALNIRGRLDEAMAVYRQAIAINANSADSYSNLGLVLKRSGKLDEAIAAHQRAIAIDPNVPEAHDNLGDALCGNGRLDEGIAAYRQALLLRPTYAEAHSNLLFSLHYHPGFDAAAIAREHRLWNQQHAEPLKQFIRPHSNDRHPERRLRIGYVSPDFRDHAVAYNLLPLFRQHDRRQFEITCYAQVVRSDAITCQFQNHADRWRDIAKCSDEQVANQIGEDGIDVLVDLALHTADNRLLLFARKPAPVQVTFAGYPGSTGLTAIDYRLSDPYLDPPDMDESAYSEKTIRLPDSFWCYDSYFGSEISPGTLPALASGVVTFGCLNRLSKINDFILSLWAAAMREIPGSRLLLLAPHSSLGQRAVDRLGREGIGPGRIEFIPRQPRREYLRSYNRIDVGLDSFPYNGHTTSLDSFWMGVPVVTLVGQTIASRAGVCLLSNLGLQELAAQTPDQFVNIAVELAKDVPRLQTLRATLRHRMEHSPLMDAPKFARNIEAAYREMWRTWCNERAVGND